MKTPDEVLAGVQNSPANSAWKKGVREYAEELVTHWGENLAYYTPPQTESELREILLDGARDWKEFSWGGCSLIYNQDIAERLCANWELKKTKNGQRRPNASEEWLDTQARALFQAEMLIVQIWRE